MKRTMPPLLPELSARFAAAIETAYGAEYAGTDPVIRRSQQAKFGDFQANAAMALAKRAGGSPRDVATRLVETVDIADLAEPLDIAGPGFINIRLRSEALARALAEAAADDRVCVEREIPTETVVVDYSHPNVAKEMHVGHLRSTIIGDAIVRVLTFLGHNVVRHNHLGDWGTPFGMLIEHLLDLGEEEAAHELSVGDLNGFYQQARQKFDSDPVFADRARQRVVLLQGGDSETLQLWSRLVEESNRYFSAVYERLDVTLTSADIRGESFYNPYLAEVAEQLEAEGLARIDDGALCAFPPGFVGRDGDPLPLIIRKTDGGYTYGATDLAAVRYRTQKVGATRLVYVVGAPQAQHLAMVYAVSEQAGWLGAGKARAEHAAFGSILGSDGRMFKTRSGETVKLVDLLDEAVARAAAIVDERSDELGPEERDGVARAVGIGAVKYADLSNDRVKDYVFDWDRMLAFEGNTGPYLQYAHARIRSIFRRAEVSPSSMPAGALVIGEPAPRALRPPLLRLPPL